MTFAVFAAVLALASPADIQKSANDFVAKAPGVVVAIGVIDPNGTHEYFAGVARSRAPKLDDRTVFQIGSITKTFTATLLADMVERGQVKLDDPIGKYLPGGVNAPAYQGKQITLLNLAEQNSGLPVLPTNFARTSQADPYVDYTAPLLYGFLNQYALTRAPGAQYEYSNLGVGLLGQLLANAAHMPYPKLLKSRILEPLGMTDTRTDITPDIDPHVMPGYAADMASEPPWRFQALAGAGAVNSDLRDMLRYLDANMRAPGGPLGKAMALAHEPRTPSLPQQRIGLNWFTNDAGVTWHNGETGGYSSYLGFNPKTHTGVVVLTNVAASRGETDLLAMHVMTPELYPSIVSIEMNPKPSGTTPFAGVYQLSPSFRIVVFERGGALYGEATAQPPFLLQQQNGLTYAVQGVAATITFVTDANGKATSLVLHQNGVDAPARRIAP